MWQWLIPLGLIVAGVLIYNSLVRLRQQTETAWSDVDVQLKRRHDLIPNLVETVRGYAGHEKATLEAVIAARARAIDAAGPAQQGRAEDTLTGALRSLFVLSESYPELKAAEGFQGLQRALSEVEEDISQSRRYYNAVVRDYNIRVGQVPSNLVAKSFGFKEREFFQAETDERVRPSVAFGNG